MAVHHVTKDFDAFILTKREAVEVISFLAAQLGNTSILPHQVGAAASFISHDERGGSGQRILMSVEPDKPEKP